MRLTWFILYICCSTPFHFLHRFNCLQFACFHSIPFSDLRDLLDPYDLLSFAVLVFISMCSFVLHFICLLLYESFFRIYFLWFFCALCLCFPFSFVGFFT